MLPVCSNIEYNLLSPLVTDKQIDAALLSTCLQLGGICVPPYWVKKASREVANTNVQLTTGIGFPLGYQRTEAKIAEMELAFADGAQAIELVINLSAFKSQRLNWIKAEVARFAHLVHEKETFLTVITEMEYLSNTEIEVFCKVSVEAGADYIRNATGLIKNSISPLQVNRLRNLLPPTVGLKIWTDTNSLAEMRALIDAGADKVCIPSVHFLNEPI